MKTVTSFLTATLTGGILFLLPVYLICILVYKAHMMAVKILTPIDRFLPGTIMGLPSGKLVAALALLILCFLAGMLFRLNFIKRGINYLEDKVLGKLPGYTLLKTKAADTLGEKIDYYISTVLVKEGESWSIGLLIEETEEYCTVYFPDAPANEAGEVKIVPARSVKKIKVPTKETLSAMKSFGKGAIQWL